MNMAIEVFNFDEFWKAENVPIWQPLLKETVYYMYKKSRHIIQWIVNNILATKKIHEYT